MTGSRLTHIATVDDWTMALAESTGSPGGGAATGVMLAISAGLTSMVAGYSSEHGDPERISEIVERARGLRSRALALADDDAAASKAFGAAFAQPSGDERKRAIQVASVDAAGVSAELGRSAMSAVADLHWLGAHGNPALIADVAVAFGALRAAIVGARTNVSFDLASLTSAGEDLAEVRNGHPQLWGLVLEFDAALTQIDAITTGLDGRVAPTLETE
ncbi:cyclodeaminase/cyclohydrolase family protein [Naasia lichenicola]|uniref:Cyclodeaminase/cyclohydrolase family protein n=1 Tax=Naasia lichenicola TaxID=2565933 RepID=A0A4S4FIL4_9MICO|nr:cyclodeaminase/cyclohydrolase family protein [Naasia lichenicola]THG30089.1 cyclodeaminase/cyclohydrolase family protein [Naasia lichenicola]